MPEKQPELSIWEPRRSFCPSCKKQLTALQLVPFFSWLFLGGKCGHCGTRIPFRYPLIELASALLALAACTRFGPTPTAFVVFLFGSALIVISVIDYDFHIIPNRITYPGTAIGLGLALLNHFTHLFGLPVAQNIFSSAVGALAGSGFLYLIAELYFRVRKIEGLGMGDVKLLAMTGAFFGPECALYTIFIGSFAGAILGLLMMLFAKKGMGYELPFGPYLALGTILFLFFGQEIMMFHLGVTPRIDPMGYP